MDARDLLLDEHGRMHSAAVTGDNATMAERTFGGLSDEQMRARPREDLNSLAWLMWHIARAEDIFANLVLCGRDQVFDDRWSARLKTPRVDFGVGMTKPEVADLSGRIDVTALREYRDAVGRRTQELVRGFGSADWSGELQADRLQKAAGLGCFGARGDMVAKAFLGRPRLGTMGALLVTHSALHMGEAQTVRTAGGFGTGV